jgi:drug/metabolite transporter (DMT)-like permease
VGNPSKAASRATQYAVAAALYFTVGVLWLALGSHGDNLKAGGAWLLAAALAGCLAWRATRRRYPDHNQPGDAAQTKYRAEGD